MATGKEIYVQTETNIEAKSETKTYVVTKTEAETKVGHINLTNMEEQMDMDWEDGRHQRFSWKIHSEKHL